MAFVIERCNVRINRTARRILNSLTFERRSPSLPLFFVKCQLDGFVGKCIVCASDLNFSALLLAASRRIVVISDIDITRKNSDHRIPNDAGTSRFLKQSLSTVSAYPNVHPLRLKPAPRVGLIMRLRSMKLLMRSRHVISGYRYYLRCAKLRAMSSLKRFRIFHVTILSLQIFNLFLSI